MRSIGVSFASLVLTRIGPYGFPLTLILTVEYLIRPVLTRHL